MNFRWNVCLGAATFVRHDPRTNAVFLRSDHPGLFYIFFVFSYKLSSQGRNQTRIVGVEGEDADHQTTTTAQNAAFIALDGLAWIVRPQCPSPQPQFYSHWIQVRSFLQQFKVEVDQQVNTSSERQFRGLQFHCTLLLGLRLMKTQCQTAALISNER